MLKSYLGPRYVPSGWRIRTIILPLRAGYLTRRERGVIFHGPRPFGYWYGFTHQAALRRALNGIGIAR